MKKALCCLAVGSGLVTGAYAQKDLLPVGQYPQFRTQSGLPGGGFGVLPDGTPSIHGAMALSTPIGYSLDNWHFEGIFSNTSDNSFFKLPHVGGHTGNVNSLGKVSGMIGVPLGRYGSLTAGIMVVSSILDRAYNFQYETPFRYKGIGISFGVQDLQGHRGIGAENLPGANALSRSYYGAITAPLPHGVFVSAGFGDRRFEKGFFNVSAPIGDRVRVFAEHDGFNFNEGVAYEPHIFPNLKFRDRQVHTQISAGLVRSKYAYWAVSMSF